MAKQEIEVSRINWITGKIISACIEIHKHLGPGLLESAYEECLCYELASVGISFGRQVPLAIVYKKVKLDCGYRIDLIVENLVIVELRAVERLMPVHEAQLLTYLKLLGHSVGLLINFNVPLLKHGIRRVVYKFSETQTENTGKEIEENVSVA